jgi:hypothetical protein
MMDILYFADLYFFATGAHISQNFVNTDFVNKSQTFIADSELYPTIFTFHPETVVVKIGQKTTTRFVVGV